MTQILPTCSRISWRALTEQLSALQIESAILKSEHEEAQATVAEREGEAQLAFEANQGVPDRTTVQSRPRVKKDDEKKNNIGCMFIISIIVIYQVLKYLFG